MKEELPIDRGWAWVICLSVFMIAFFILTGSQVNSIGFLDMVRELDTTVTKLSIGVTVQLFSTAVFALLSVNLFVPAVGERKTVAVAGIGIFLGSIVMSFAPNVPTFILGCFLKGASGGSCFVPCIALVGNYFRKRRSIATALSICGTCVAGIGPPRLIRSLVDEYGIRGTYLLLAAIELHMVAFALLLRPLSSYGPPPAEKPEADSKEEDQNTADTEMKLMDNNETQHKKNPPLNVVGRTVSFDSPNPEEEQEESKDKEAFLENGESVLKENANPNEITAVDQEGLSDDHKDKQQRVRSMSDASVGSVIKRRRPILERGQSVWSMMSSGQSSMAIDGDIIAEKKTQNVSGCAKLKVILDLTLFKLWGFRTLILGDIFASSNTYLIAFFPTLVVIQGATKDEAATLQTILGVVDLLGRLFVGFIADLKYFRPSQVSASGLLCLATMCHVSPYFPTFNSMIGMSVGLGLFIGIRQTLCPVVHIEVIGIQRMSKSFSFSILVIASGAAAHSAFLSAILDSTGTTRIVFHYIGCVVMLYGIMLLCLPLVQRMEKRFKG